MFAPFHTSPIQEIEDELLSKQGVQLFIKRDDLIHPEIQGNKWRKLKYNLQEAQNTGAQTLLTFGGPYSNHIYATAVAADFFNFKSIGIIRGERPEPLTDTLKFATLKGMELHYLDRANFKIQSASGNSDSLHEQFGDFYLLPHGGTNILALKGVSEIMDEITIDFDVICTACGTGGTLAGLVAALKGEKQVIGFSALKGDDTLTDRVKELVREFTGNEYSNFKILFDYHFGGYAKVKSELIDFIKDFGEKNNIQLEPVYTGKMFYGLFDLIESGYFEKGTRIIALHTGGLQGLSGFRNYFSESELSGVY